MSSLTPFGGALAQLPDSCCCCCCAELESGVVRPPPPPPPPVPSNGRPCVFNPLPFAEWSRHESPPLTGTARGELILGALLPQLRGDLRPSLSVRWIFTGDIVVAAVVADPRPGGDSFSPSCLRCCLGLPPILPREILLPPLGAGGGPGDRLRGSPAAAMCPSGDFPSRDFPRVNFGGVPAAT